MVSEDSLPKRASDSASHSNPTTESRKQDVKDIWTIRYFSDEEAIAFSSAGGKIVLPSKSHVDCDDCRRDATYTSSADAIKHLVSEHYATGALTKTQQEAISIFIRNRDQVRASKLNSARLNILVDCLEHLQPVTTRAKEIIEVVAGVISDRSEDEFAYYLPRTVVRAFQHSSIFIIAASHAIRLVEGHFHADNWTLQDGDVPSYRGFVSFLGVRADIAMTNAIKDVILMVRTGETSESVNYAAVGPRYIALVMYKNLLTQNVMAQTGLLDLYRKCTSKLVCRPASTLGR
jgi:hypothetical protein